MKFLALSFSFALLVSCRSSDNMRHDDVREDSHGRTSDQRELETSGPQTPQTEPVSTENEIKVDSNSSEKFASQNSTGWTSGGGGVFGNQGNPWFLDNYPSISYCILIDQENFSSERLTPRQWAQRIQSGFEFWTKEFEYANNSWANFLLQHYRKDAAVVLDLTKIKFVWVETCQANTDITFQLGELNPLQEQYLAKEFDQVVAAAIRTEYDTVHLKGKGFVYFSPEQGPRAPKVKELKANRWAASSRIFERVLFHELGHVLGIRHLAQSIMDDEYVDKLVTESKSVSSLDSPQDSFFNFLGDKRFFACKMPFFPAGWPFPFSWEQAWERLGLKPEQECAEFVFSPKDWNLEIYEFQMANTITGETPRRGSLVGRSGFAYLANCTPIEYRESTFTIHLDNEQKVYDTTRRRLYGPFLINGISCYFPPGIHVEREPDESLKYMRDFVHIRIEKANFYMVVPESFPGAGNGFDFYANPFDPQVGFAGPSLFSTSPP